MRTLPRPTQSLDPQKCADARWCDEVDGHDGEHVSYLGSTTMHTPAGRPVVVAVNMRGWNKPDRRCELVVDGTALSPRVPELDWLLRMLQRARGGDGR